MTPFEGSSAVEAERADIFDLVCSSGHRTPHSLARVLRLNDGWCGTCGADIGYTPLGSSRAESDTQSDALPVRLTSI